MKKLKLFLISLFILVASLPLFYKVGAFAEHSTNNEVQTGIFLPTSYLQYYKLQNPYAICRYKDDDEDFVAISHKNAIVIYKNEKFFEVPLELGEVSVKVIQRYKNFLLYLYNSKIYYVDITDFENDGWQAKCVDTKIPCNSSFSISGDSVVIHSSDFITKYQIVTDLSGGFAIDESTKEEKLFQNSAMLLLLPDGQVYTSKIGQDGIFSWDDSTTPIINASNVESIICNDDGSSIYYSCPKGIYQVNVNSADKAPIQVVSATDIESNSDLGKIYTPKGICLVNNTLWVVDSSINAVQEIDLLNDNKFTNFAITTNSTAINRLTENVQDIVVDKDKIYALDSGRIVVINNIDSEDRTYNRINLSVAQIDEFSVGNEYVCYYSAGFVHLAKITESQDDELIFELDEKAQTELAGVVDITYSENAFYLVTTETIDNNPHPVVYKISLASEPHELKQVLSDKTQIGSAMEVVADVFGTIYYCSKNNSNYEFYSFDGNNVKFISTRPIELDVLNLQTDFDGNLFALYENNTIDVINETGVITKTLKTSDNLGSINPAKSVCLSCNSQTAYFIFEGLILNSSNVSDLNISTPHTIEIPEGFNTAYNPTQQFAKVKEGAKLFEIDLEVLDGEYFKFVDYVESIDTQTDYAVITLSDKYSLLIKDGLFAVARNSDIIDRKEIDSANFTKFAIVDFTSYSVPVLENQFKTTSSFNKFDVVEIAGTITFNEINYFVVKDGENFGYVPSSFFVDSIISEDGNQSMCDVYVFKKGGITVYDKDGNVIGVIEKKTRVTVLETGAKLTILYGNGVGYIDSDYIVTSSKSEILKSIAIILCALSICITALYFEKRFLLNGR